MKITDQPFELHLKDFCVELSCLTKNNNLRTYSDFPLIQNNKVMTQLMVLHCCCIADKAGNGFYKNINLHAFVWFTT